MTSPPIAEGGPPGPDRKPRALMRPRVRQFLALLNAGAVGVGLSLLNSVLLVRLLGADVFGQYAYLIAVLSIIPTFYETFNKVLVRFLGTLPLRRQFRLLTFVLLAKVAVFLIVLAVFLSWHFLIGDWKLDSILARGAFYVVFLAVILAFPLKLVANVLRSVLNAQERYHEVAFLLVLPTVIPVAINGWLLLAGATGDVILRWLALELWITPLAGLSLALTLLWRSGWLAEMKAVRVRSYWRAFAFGYTHYFAPYGQPLSIAVVFQYVKQYLPLILLGQVGTFSNVGYYRVLAGIADLGTEFLPSVANAMLPSLVRSRERDPSGFGARFARHGAGYLLAMGLFTVAFTVGHPLVLWAYDLPTTPEVALASLLVSLMIMQAAFGFLLNYLFVLGGQTKANYAMAPLHNVFYAVCIVLLTPYLLVGMLVARLLHRMFGSVLLTYVSVVRMDYLTGRQYFTLLSLMLGLSALSVLAFLTVVR